MTRGHPLADRYRDKLRERFGLRLQEVILFGSRARGDAEPSSDIDVVVVVRDLTEAERSEAIDLALAAWRAHDTGGPLLSPLVWSEREWQEWTASERSIAIDILREGIRL